MPGYLGPFTCVTDLPSRRSLHSVGTNRLVVPTSRLSTVGSRAFPIAGPQTWKTSRKTLHQQNHWPHFLVSSWHTCSGSLFWLHIGHQLTVSSGPSSTSTTYATWKFWLIDWLIDWLRLCGGTTRYTVMTPGCHILWETQTVGTSCCVAVSSVTDRWGLCLPSWRSLYGWKMSVILFVSSVNHHEWHCIA